MGIELPGSLDRSSARCGRARRSHSGRQPRARLQTWRSRGPGQLALACFLVALLGVAKIAPAQSSPTSPLENVVEYKLENGWRFLLYPRPGAPTLSFETYVSVGSADDPVGMSGMANLVKNLLFKGSERVGSSNWALESEALDKLATAHADWQKAIASGSAQEISAAKRLFESARVKAAEFVVREEFSRIMEAAGGSGTLNAFVDQNSTRFVVSLPSNQAELWCWMESERFLKPVFREFFVERAALQEEWGTRTSGDATGALSAALRAAAYGSHPLGRPSAGLGQEIAQLQPTAAMDFFREHYGPRQMITTIVGNMDPDSMLPLLKRSFGRIPQREDSPTRLPIVPEQQAERRVQVESGGAPLVWIAWHVPPLAHPDSPAIEIAMRILGFARSSRLERRLTRNSSLATSLSVQPVWEGDRRASLALIRCTPTLGTSTLELEKVIYEEIQRLADEGPTREELNGVKRVAAADHYRSLRVNPALAAGLGSSLAKTGLWRHFFERERRLDAVQGKEVQRVLAKWFVKKRRTVATLVAPAAVKEVPAADRPAADPATPNAETNPAEKDS